MEKLTDEELEQFNEWFPLTRENADAGFIPVLGAHWMEWFVCVNDDIEEDYEKAQQFNNQSQTRELREQIYLARNGKWFIRKKNGFHWIDSGWSVTTQVFYELEDAEGVSDV